MINSPAGIDVISKIMPLPRSSWINVGAATTLGCSSSALVREEACGLISLMTSSAD